MLILLALTMLGATSASSQFFTVSGTIADERGTPLPEANVALFTQADTLLLRGNPANPDGQFTLRRVPGGAYLIVVSHLGYRSTAVPIEVTDRDITGLRIQMPQEIMEMDGVEITARPDPVELRGDTTVFSAAAFPVREDAVAEDLLRRMPGFTMQDGELQTQGERVQRVLVDGQEFFGDDPSVALRNLPAEIIRQIEVFDQATEQAQFTGFDDGETTLTINIVTRGGIRDGQFGRANLSGGSNDRYLGGGNYNHFSGNRRISLIGLANNINQVNFSNDYLAGVAQAGQTSSRRGGRGGRGGRQSSGNIGDFLINDQQGVNAVQSFGINYIDRWNDSWRINSSYFFNRTSNTNDLLLERLFLEDESMDERYYEQSRSESQNYNHRFNSRLEYRIDPLRSVIVTPRVSLGYDDSNRSLNGATIGQPVTGNPSLMNETINFNEADNFRYNLNNNILYRRQFLTRGRTFSMNLSTQADSRTGDQLQLGLSRYYESQDDLFRSVSDDQFVDIKTRSTSVRASIQYTEPVSENGQVSLAYAPSFEFSDSERMVFRSDDITDRFEIADIRLSSQFENREYSHTPSLRYRYRSDAWRFGASLAWEYTMVEGEQIHPLVTSTRRNFSNLLPGGNIRYRFSESTDVRVRYRTNTRTPSVSQLQDVIDMTNPLLWTGGNPDLREQYIHQVNLRLRQINARSQTALIGLINVAYTQDYIGNRTVLADRDMEMPNGLVLERGGRLITPDQTGNAWDLRSFLNYSLPVAFLRSNLNLNTGVRYRETPSIINDRRNIGYQTDLDAGFNLNSVISPEVDFTLAYTAGYRFVRNSIREDLDDDYYTGRASARFTVLPWEWLILESDLNLLHFEGLSDDFNRNIAFWNASVGYRFLSNRAAQLRLTVTDILGQNSSISRIVTDIYIQDTQSEVLTRFVMLTFSYNFRSFQEGR